MKLKKLFFTGLVAAPIALIGTGSIYAVANTSYVGPIEYATPETQAIINTNSPTAFYTHFGQTSGDPFLLYDSARGRYVNSNSSFVVSGTEYRMIDSSTNLGINSTLGLSGFSAVGANNNLTIQSYGKPVSSDSSRRYLNTANAADNAAVYWGTNTNTFTRFEIDNKSTTTTDDDEIGLVYTAGGNKYLTSTNEVFQSAGVNRSYNKYSAALDRQPFQLVWVDYVKNVQVSNITTTTATITYDFTEQGSDSTNGTSASSVEYSFNGTTWISTPATENGSGSYSINLTGLSPNTTYTVYLRTNEAYNNVWTDQSVTFTTSNFAPSEISNITLNTTTADSATINYELTRNQGSGVVEYRVYPTSTGSGSATWTSAGSTLASGIYTIQPTGLTSNTQYTLDIRVDGVFDPADTITFTTQVAYPTISNVYLTNLETDNVTLHYTLDYNDFSDPQIQYQYTQDTNNNGVIDPGVDFETGWKHYDDSRELDGANTVTAQTAITPDVGGEPEDTVPGYVLRPDTLYQVEFRVSRSQSATDSTSDDDSSWHQDPSTTIQFTTQESPQGISNLYVTDIGTDTATLHYYYTAGSGAGEIKYSINGGTPVLAPTQPTNTGSYSIPLTGLNPGVVNNVDLILNDTTVLSTSFNTLTDPTTTITNVSATVTGTNSVRVYFEATSADAATVRYTLTDESGEVNPVENYYGVGTDPSKNRYYFDVPSLTENTLYNIQLYIAGDYGKAEITDKAVVTTDQSDTALVSTSVVDISTTTATIQYQIDPGKTGTGTTLEYSINNGTWIAVPGYDDGLSTTQSFSLTGLTNNTEYEIKFRMDGVEQTSKTIYFQTNDDNQDDIQDIYATEILNDSATIRFNSAEAPADIRYTLDGGTAITPTLTLVSGTTGTSDAIYEFEISGLIADEKYALGLYSTTSGQQAEDYSFFRTAEKYAEFSLNSIVEITTSSITVDVTLQRFNNPGIVEYSINDGSWILLPMQLEENTPTQLTFTGLNINSNYKVEIRVDGVQDPNDTFYFTTTNNISSINNIRLVYNSFSTAVVQYDLLVNDGLGVVDYALDANENGVVDNGETWQRATSANRASFTALEDNTEYQVIFRVDEQSYYYYSFKTLANIEADDWKNAYLTAIAGITIAVMIFVIAGAASVAGYFYIKGKK